MPIGNTLMEAMLRSPLHSLLDGSMLLITVTGKSSGKKYTLPVNYVRKGDRLILTSMRNRTWWRNLRDGAEARILLKGKEVRARATVIETEQEVTTGLDAYLRLVPQYARYFGVQFDANKQPVSADVARAAKERVIIYLAPC